MNKILFIPVRSSGTTQPVRSYMPVINRKACMHFTRVEEILLNDSFYQWYLQTDEAEVRRWNEWRLADEVHNRLLEEAVSALHKLLGNRDEEGHPRPIHAVYSRLQRAKKQGTGNEGRYGLPGNRADIPELKDVDIHLS